MVIVCSITNPSQLNAVYSIQLQRNSSTTFETIVSVATGQTPPVQWKDTQLQGRASATGSVDSPSTAQLRLAIDKHSLICPTDFKMYMCQLTGYNSYLGETVTQETSPITISYIVKSAVIEMPRVKILNELFDTPDRQFPVGTAITLTCQGQVGSDKSNTIRWCAQKTNEMMFAGLPQTPIHSEASLSGCIFTRFSTVTYNLTSQDTFTKFLCESGDTGLCGTGTAIQYVNISTTVTEGSSTTSAPSTDDLSPSPSIPTTDASVQNIHIQVFPQTVNYKENDLVIVCSIINPSQLNAVYNIELQKNSSTTFETIVSVATGQTPSVQWKDITEPGHCHWEYRLSKHCTIKIIYRQKQRSMS
uniref:Ig-like domain-containing protein n=1 Tax=Magallana gigas TaxID=29159 RepID=A0A8W8LHE6_MAGGI